MTTSLTDAQLLRAFATERDQTAFGELVRRHQNMVYSTALRKLGRSDLAADVAQNVFLALATKAAWLSHKTNVGGWLYKSTLFEAARRQRDDLRRLSREHLYAEDMKANPPSENDDEAQRAGQLLPLLDQAMSTLPEADREALVLRFFRDLSLRETGAALGTTEEAARKRVSRALEKLSSLFRRQGVTASAALLASTVLPQAVDAAPAGLAVKLSATAATAPATGFLGSACLKVAALSKAQAVAYCLAAAAVPVSWQAFRIHQLEGENARMADERGQWHSQFEGAIRNVLPPPASIAINAPPRTSAAKDPRANPPDRRNRRGALDQLRELDRQRLQQSRLAALEERLGLSDDQLSVIAEASGRAETDVQAAQEAARESRTPVDPAQLAAIAKERDDAITAALSTEQWDGYLAFTQEEDRSRQEIFANRMLEELQWILLLDETQKDELFAHFASQAPAPAGESGRDPGGVMGNGHMEALSQILTEEQFRQWRQRTEMWAQFFRRGRGPAPEKPAASAPSAAGKSDAKDIKDTKDPKEAE
jgi:RNA polymerase sigma factor (sigma-70 family)